ncbi:MAG: Asp-tRNA(Asn)/Glu-tRNA(Gln) amidotransferase subunit GatA [candidate division WOR-3 bacterium]
MNTIDEIHELYARGELSPAELIAITRERIEAEEPELNAFINLFLDEAEEQANALGKPPEPMPPLWGIPFGVKDNICYQDHETTCASRILLGYRPPYTATALRRVLEAGAIIVGKTNMDEFAMGSTGEYSYFGPTSNPLNKDHVPGGTSSGSAAAVGAGLVPFALGSDTGGSVRQPGAWCGVVGFKPSYGRVSRYGLIAFASSLDQIGVISRSVRDSLRVFLVMGGYDPMDSTTSRMPLPSEQEIIRLHRETKLRVGLPREYFGQGTDPEIADAVMEGAMLLEKDGYTLKEISLPHTRYVIPCYQIVVAAECSSNLARFDGIRYGFRAEGTSSLEEIYVKTRSEGFGPEVKRRIAAGAFVLSAGYQDKYFLRAQKVRRLIRRDYDDAFKEVDVILSPTFPVPPVKKGESLADPLAVYLMDTLTAAANLAGIPGISVPGHPDSRGFRPGIHISAPYMGEETMFIAALRLEELQNHPDSRAP